MNRVDRAMLKATKLSKSVDTGVYIVTYWPKDHTENEHAGEWEVLFHVKNSRTGEFEPVKNYFKTEEEAFNSIEAQNNAYAPMGKGIAQEPVVIYNDIGLLA